MAANPKLISTVRNLAIKIVAADGTGNKSFAIAAPADGSRLKSMHITSDDTAPQVLQVIVTIGAVDFILGEISVPAGAGTDGATSAVNGLAGTRIPALQTDGITKWLDIANGTTLSLKSKVAVTAAKTIYAFAEVGDFT